LRKHNEDAAMSPEELARLIRSRPFIPLRLHLTNGEAFDIRHPELAIIGRSVVDIGFDPDPEYGIVDRKAYIGLSHIVRVERLEPAPKPGKSNGEDRP
jgi:hypothetical protein